VLHTQTVDWQDPAWQEMSLPRSATYLTRGPRTGQVALLAQEADQSTLSLYDPAPAGGMPQPVWTQPSAPGALLAILQNSAGELNVGWTNQGATTRSQNFVYIDPHDRAIQLGVLAVDAPVYEAAVRGDSLILVTGARRTRRGQDEREVRSLPLRAVYASAGSGSAPVSLSPATRLSRLTVPAAESGKAISLGPGLLAYIADDGLHAQTYDSGLDLLLEAGVTRLYAPDTLADPDAIRTLP
jgi:hypothetical protein